MDRKTLEVSQFVKKITGLLLLPPAEVSDCFALEFLSNLPNDKRVEQFCDYLLENYIDAEATFPPPVWSESSASSLRTISLCELLFFFFLKDLLHRKSVRYTELQNYEIVPLTNLP